MDDIPTEEDWRAGRPEEMKRIDLMVDQMAEMAIGMKTLGDLVGRIGTGQTQRVVYKQEGMGVVGIICATVCVMCVVIVILGAIVFVPDIHDLRAWNDITRKDIARLQALHQQPQKEPQK